jgi:hypothetical protein
MKMIKLCISFIMFLAFTAGAVADDGWVIRDPSQPVLVSAPKARALASTGGLTKLPDRLPIGSRETVLDYVISTNGFRIHVDVSLGAISTKRIEIGITKDSYGYASYGAFLEDVREGFRKIVDTFRTYNIGPETNCWATIYVNYFAGDSRPDDVTGNGIAILTQNRIGAFKDVTLDKIMTAHTLSSEIQILQVIVPVPRLESVEMAVEIQPGLTASMTWNEASGATLSSVWSASVGPREWTTPTYLYLRYPVADGSHYTRINLASKNGEKVSYTQFGYKVEEPTLGFSTSGIRIGSNPGSDVLVESTSNFQDWKAEFFVKSAQADMTLPFPIKGTQMFFRATAR